MTCPARALAALVLLALAEVAVAKPVASPAVRSTHLRGDHLRAVLDAPLGVLSELELEAASRALIAEHGPSGARRIELWARLRDGRVVPATSVVPMPPPLPNKALRRAYGFPLVRRVRPRAAAFAPSTPGALSGDSQGFLSGKTVYLSAGHGWTWNNGTTTYVTQRGLTWGIVEDLVSAEAVDQYLVHYLVAAGADVFTVRERDLQTQMVIVDDTDTGYGETGPTFRASTQPGFAQGRAPYLGDDNNPMRAGGCRVFDATAAEVSVARWTPTIPASGAYVVYASYAAFSDRAPDAHYVVHHAGGETHLRVDQRRHGQTWVPLGRFYFEAGMDAARASVELRSDSSQPGAILSADAVRFGGGMGDIQRGTVLSGKPRYEEAARYYAQYMGAPTSVFSWLGTHDDHSDDVSSRSRLTAWLHEPGEDALYLAWHTNAPSPGRGTSTYVYGPNPPDGSYNFTGAAGSDRLARLVHDEIVGDLRAAFDPSWTNLGVFSAYFGEVNPSHNSEMPSALVEVAFHDTQADAADLKEPVLRRLVARAMYQGIAKYFAEKDGVAVKLAPEPPTHLALRSWGPGRLRVMWRAPSTSPGAGDPATGYRVYRSRDGHGWDEGTPVTDAQLVLENLAPGETVFIRVTSTNDGGESFPTETLGAHPAASQRATLLFVHAFDRLDGASLVKVDTPTLGTVSRMLLDRMNRFDLVLPHARAAIAAGLSFDSAHSRAVASGDVDLAAYQAVVWMAGEESTVDESFSTDEQVAVRAYVASGGKLFASGAEIAWDLGYRGAASDQAFLHEVLHADYAEDDGNVPTLTGTGAFATLPTLTIDDGSRGAYDVDYPDVLTPGADASAVLLYEGTTKVAAIAKARTVVFLGAPLDALYPEEARNALFARAMSLLEVAEPPPPPMDGGLADGGLFDGGFADGGAVDGGLADGGATDGGKRDAGLHDAGSIDAGLADGGTVAPASGGCGCDASASGHGGGLWLFFLGAHLLARRRTKPARPTRG